MEKQTTSENTINVYTNGHAGQSLAAYAPKGLMIHHTGDANDYVGKGLLVVRSLSKHLLKNDKMKLLLVTSHSMVRQVVRHLLTVVQEKDSGIRNSGVDVVVEGIGDHGLEYMTGGHVINLGDVGKNFGQVLVADIAHVIPSDLKSFC